jgi:uncharacterized protein (DUF3820 family)
MVIDQEESKRRRHEIDLTEKPALLEQRSKSGEHVIPFGKHKGKQIKELPLDYVRWMLGYKREGRNFTTIPADKLNWMRTTQYESLGHAQKYMVWRCWGCGSEDTRFKHSKLCTTCWHECE